MTGRKPLAGQWSHLSSLQAGQYAEYFGKMEFTRAGFDVYASEVDEKGTDILVRKGLSRFYDVQVKSARRASGAYVFMEKQIFSARPNLFAAVVLLHPADEPEIFLVPSQTWLRPKPPYVSRDYEGKKSKPEYGVNIATKHLDVLRGFALPAVAKTL